MTAQQELQDWLEQHRQLEGDTDRAQFYQNLLVTLGEKDSDNLHEGLLALRQSVRASRIKAENKIQAKPPVSFQIFPKTQQEQELLRQLLEHLNIPFKMSA